MSCEDVRTALSVFDACVETEEGSRVTTHCLYPSFENVHVFVSKFGGGFRVHDGGGAARVSWVHGRDYPLIKKVIARQAARYSVAVSDSGDTFMAEAPDVEWLASAILAVANASASAAHLVVERIVSATEALLGDRIYDALKRVVPSPSIAREYDVSGKSGKRHRFDFAVPSGSEIILIDAVAPHHISISAKYVAFSDVSHRHELKSEKFAVHDRKLEPGDESLLLQVAEIVQISSLEPGIRRALLQ